MELINENNLEKVCGGQEIKRTLAKTLSTVGISFVVCSLLAASSVLILKDIKKTNRELKKYPKVDDTKKAYKVTQIITINN